jgi:hypothetical protein
VEQDEQDPPEVVLKVSGLRLVEVVVGSAPRLRYSDGTAEVVFAVDSTRALAKVAAQLADICLQIERGHNAWAGPDEQMRHERVGQGLMLVRRQPDASA